MGRPVMSSARIRFLRGGKESIVTEPDFLSLLIGLSEDEKCSG